VDAAGHDADLALAGLHRTGNGRHRSGSVQYLDDTGAVGADEASLALLGQPVFHPDHVELRDALGDADDQWDFSVHCVQDGRGRQRGRHVDHTGVGVHRVFGLRDTVNRTGIVPFRIARTSFTVSNTGKFR